MAPTVGMVGPTMPTTTRYRSHRVKHVYLSTQSNQAATATYKRGQRAPWLETYIRVKSRAVHLLKLLKFLHRILISSNPILILVCCDFGSISSARINKKNWLK